MDNVSNKNQEENVTAFISSRLSTDGLTDDALEHIASVLRENKALAELT